MTNQQFIRKLKSEFKQRLEQKTGWGRTEVWVIFIESIVEALSAADEGKEEESHDDEIREASVGQTLDEEAG